MPGDRARALRAVDILLRIQRKAAECFPGDDLETIFVLLTVAAASAGPALRDRALLDLIDQGPLPDQHHRPISGLAVARSSGLPREVVRRRLQALEQSGRLIKETNGYRTRSDDISRARNLEFIRFLIRELSAANGRLRPGADGQAASLSL